MLIIDPIELLLEMKIVIISVTKKNVASILASPQWFSRQTFCDQYLVGGFQDRSDIPRMTNGEARFNGQKGILIVFGRSNFGRAASVLATTAASTIWILKSYRSVRLKSKSFCGKNPMDFLFIVRKCPRLNYLTLHHSCFDDRSWMLFHLHQVVPYQF